ncbi:MAG: hypothetical protein Q7V57_12960 [Actinomycetota bacterium]|nr:hypothetical protein [Actinomycetota bacterium]
MSDELFALIDARGRAAGAALRAEAVFRAPARAKVTSPTRGWLRPVLLVGVVAAMVVGLVMVAGRGDDQAVDHAPSGLRYLVGDLPDGWTAHAAKDAGVSTGADFHNVQLTLYGTSGNPATPALQLAWSDPAQADDGEMNLMGDFATVLHFTAAIRSFTVSGRDAACGELPDDELYCSVDLAEGLVQLRARQVPFEAVKVALQTLRIVDGSPQLDQASLPSTVAFVTSGDMDVVSAAAAGNVDSVEVSSVEYVRSDGDALRLVTGWADQQDIAFAAMQGRFQRVPFGEGVAYWKVLNDPTSAQLVWVSDGRSLSLTARGDVSTLVALAASVRPASNAEWADMPVRPQAGGDIGTEDTIIEAAPETTGPGTDSSDDVDPPVTLAPGTDIVDVPVTQVMVATSPDDADFSVQLPDGTFATVSIAILGDSVLVRKPGGGATGGPLSSMADPFVMYLGNDGRSGAYILTTDASVRQLRVTRSNGERYVMDFVQMPAHPGVFIAVLPLPANSLIRADVIDAAGRVLTTG